MPRKTAIAAANLAEGFPPIAAAGARVLVLGSMPGAMSLAKREYYGHPRNAFWTIMGELFGAGPQLPYEQRLRVLVGRRVAVWDTLRRCHRAGSLDTAICAASEQANDFATFFAAYPGIGHVFFNGQKSETAYRRHVLPTLAGLDRNIHYLRLPSTSPAHAGRSLDEKLKVWRAVARALKRG